MKHFGSKNSNPPKLIIFFGHYGSSKSTISRMVSNHFQWPYFSYESLPVTTNNSSLSCKESAQEREIELWAAVEPLLLNQLKESLTIVIDTTALSEPVWKMVERFKKQLPNLKVLPVMMSIDEETYLTRMKNAEINSASLRDNIVDWSHEELTSYHKLVMEKRFPSLMVMDCNRSIEKIFKNTVSMFYGSIFQ